MFTAGLLRAFNMLMYFFFFNLQKGTYGEESFPSSFDHGILQ